MRGLRRLPFVDQAWRIWNRRRQVALLAFVVPITAALGVSMFLPKVYKSKALVVVERAADPANDDVEARLGALTRQNLGRSRLKALIARYHLYPEARSAGEASELLVDRLQNDLRIDLDQEDRGGRTAVVAIHVTSSARSPQLAAALANDVARFYEREDLQMRESRARYATEKLQRQLAEARQRLEEQAGRLTAYKKQHLTELPEQVGLHLSALAQINQQMRGSRAEAGMSVSGAAPQGATDRPAAPHDERLDRLAELRTRFTEEHPDVKSLKREIAMVPFVVNQGLEAPVLPPPQALDPSAALAERRTRIEGVRQRVAQLKEEAAAHEREILNAPFRQQELEALLPDYVAARTQYQSLWEKYEIAQLWDPRQDGGQLRVLDAAVARDQAVSPNVRRLLGMGAALSAAAAVGVAFIAERLDPTFHNVQDLRAFTSIPVLASIPRLITGGDKRSDRRRQRRFAAMLMVIVVITFVGAAQLGRSAQTLLALLELGHA